jgi:hypothetical protein
MEITFKEIPEEIVDAVRITVERMVEDFHRRNIKVPQAEIDKAEASISAYKDANKVTPIKEIVE